MTAEAEEDFLVAIRRLIRASGWGPADVALFETLAAEYDALRARIEAAPHGGSCRSRFDEWTGKRHTYRKGPCDCWKSAALAGPYIRSRS